MSIKFNFTFIISGDLAYYREDGYIFIVDRLKELIKYKGNQVSVRELSFCSQGGPKQWRTLVRGFPGDLAYYLRLTYNSKTDFNITLACIGKGVLVGGGGLN